MSKTEKEKPYNGEIHSWQKIPFDTKKYTEIYKEDAGLGYVITGHVLHHPHYSWKSPFHTSLVVSFNEETGEVETRNSRYKVIGPERKG